MRTFLHALRQKLTCVAGRLRVWWNRLAVRAAAGQTQHATRQDSPFTATSTVPTGEAAPAAPDAPASLSETSSVADGAVADAELKQPRPSRTDESPEPAASGDGGADVLSESAPEVGGRQADALPPQSAGDQPSEARSADASAEASSDDRGTAPVQDEVRVSREEPSDESVAGARSEPAPASPEVEQATQAHATAELTEPASDGHAADAAAGPALPPALVAPLGEETLEADGHLSLPPPEPEGAGSSAGTEIPADGREWVPGMPAGTTEGPRGTGDATEPRSQDEVASAAAAIPREPDPPETGAPILKTTVLPATDTAAGETSAPLPAPTERQEPPTAAVSAPPLHQAEYLMWNRALAQHSLLADGGNDDVYLSVTPTILAAALSDVHPCRQLSEDAEAHFVEAVAEVYRAWVIGHREKLRMLRRCGPNGLPDCIAFLAASVLAAYRMQSDEEAAATAYYVRLADLLKCDLVGGHPRGFDPDEFGALWRFLETWLRREKGRRLAMPGPDVGLRRFVALPLTHVPLRCVDIERLPELFTWAGYEPGAKITRQKLDQDLASWSLGRSVFTNAGMAALADDRRPAVLAQIAHELEAWDGSHTDSLGRRSARVEILFDPVQHRPEFFYLPRRPAAFPRVFDDGIRVFEAYDEGWYDQVPIPCEDGAALAEGFAWEAVAGRLRVTLHRPGTQAIALAESHECVTGYLSHRSLKLGMRGAALCREALADSAAEYLNAISQQRCVPLNHPNVPDGWRLFTGIKPVRRLDAPPGLEALAVESAVDLIPTGGLRLGSRWAWLAGAPPRLLVAGLSGGERVTIDGEAVAVAEDGTLAADARLAQLGTHVVEAGGLRRRIEIVEPEIRTAPRAPDGRGTAVALPRGSWSLLGAVPGEVAHPVWQSRAGTVALCAFPAIWAVDAGAGPGASVLCLVANPPAPGRVERFKAYGQIARSLLAWASTIYNAAMRRPRVALVHGGECGAEIRDAWTEYARAARDIKRRFRKARR